MKRVIYWKKGESEVALEDKLSEIDIASSMINNTGLFNAQKDFKITITVTKEVLRKKKRWKKEEDCGEMI